MTKCAIPIQKLVRGHIQRVKYYAIVGNKKLELEKEKKKEAAEAKLFEEEDKLAMALELIERADKERYEAEKAARAEARRQEVERYRQKIIKAANTVKKSIRAQINKRKRRTALCEEMFKRAFALRDEAHIRRAIAMPKIFGVSSKLIKMQERDAKDLILEVMKESYVVGQLKDAIKSGCLEILQDAVKLAEDSGMVYLSELGEAKERVENILQLLSTLGSLKETLSRCVSVPKLLARVGELRDLVSRATDLGLGGERAVVEAAVRIDKIKALVVMRDKIRFAVEICSLSQMEE